MITPRAVAVWLGVVLLWAPLPFGSVTPLATTILQLALVVAGVAVAWSSSPRATLRPVAVPITALEALAVLALVQSLPWPRFLAGVVSPAHAELSGVLPDGAVADAAAQGVRLSLAPGASRSVALSIALLTVALAAGAVAGRSVRGRLLLLGAFVSSLLFQVGYGLRNWLSGRPEVWGREVQTPGGVRLRGTFVNPDHAAILLEIGLAVCLAWLWWGVRRARRRASLEDRMLLVLPPAACWLATGLGLVLTGSRAALLAAAVATLGQTLLMLGRSRLRRAPLALLPLAAIAAVAVAVAGQAGFGRLAGTTWDEIATNPRFRIWGLALAAWRRFPWTGSGLGSWEEAVASFLPADLADVRWNRAHNDYLELLATGGVVGALLVTVAMVAWVRAVTRRLGEARPSVERAAAQAALGAALAVGVHELFDFGLGLPANAVAFLTLAGVGAAGLSPAPASGGPLPVPRRGS